jgi:hypothetical protein
VSSRNRLRYDKKVKRFRDARGRFVSYDRGIRSSTARTQYYRVPVKRRYIPPAKRPKPKPKPKPRKKRPPPPPPVPHIEEVHQAPGQRVVTNAYDFNIKQLAALLLLQIESGAFRFRFWYKLPSISADYPTGIGSTPPLLKSVITRNEVLSEVIGFIRGRSGWVKGRIQTYWFSKRRMRYEPHPSEAAL